MFGVKSSEMGKIQQATKRLAGNQVFKWASKTNFAELPEL